MGIYSEKCRHKSPRLKDILSVSSFFMPTISIFPDLGQRLGNTCLSDFYKESPISASAFPHHWVAPKVEGNKKAGPFPGPFYSPLGGKERETGYIEIITLFAHLSFPFWVFPKGKVGNIILLIISNGLISLSPKKGKVRETGKAKLTIIFPPFR
jgi:hypothetical protein